MGSSKFGFVVAAGILFALGIFLFLNCSASNEDRWKYSQDHASICRRVRENYGTERQQRRDKRYIARKGWSVDVELGSAGRENSTGSSRSWTYMDDYDSVRRRVSERYGTEREQLRDRKYMAKMNWSVDVEFGGGTWRVSSMPKPPTPAVRTAGRSGSAVAYRSAEFVLSPREARSYSLPTPAAARTTANVPGRILTSSTAADVGSGGVPTSSAAAPATRRRPVSEQVSSILSRESSMVPSQVRTAEEEESVPAPAYDTLREEAPRAGWITLPPPAYTANPRNGEVVAERREEDDRLGGVREEGHREGVDRAGRRGVWVTTFHADS